jgi:uncharacterized protein (TIGR02757 family)
MKSDLVKLKLDEAYLLYNTSDFILNDPIQLPHAFSLKQDCEIAGFFAAIMAWGQRVTIINKGLQLIEYMNYKPYDFVKNGNWEDWQILNEFKHRTFKGEDVIALVAYLHDIYNLFDSLEDYLFQNPNEGVFEAIVRLKKGFEQSTHFLPRANKHLPSPLKKSACKRLNMYFRWMTRKDHVDLGIWNKISTAQLLCPLDVHVLRVAEELGLIKNPKSDWQTVITLSKKLANFDPKDPIKYDLALFGLGVNEKNEE